MRSVSTRLALAALAAAMSSCGGGNASEDGRADVSQAVGEGRLKASKEAFDFGEIGMGEMVMATFSLSNVGSTSVGIASLTTDCACTTASVGADRIEPGGQTAVEVVLDSHGLIGREAHSVTLVTDKGQTLSFMVAATIKSE